MTNEEINVAIAEACGVQTKMFRFLVPYHDGQEIYRSRFKSRDAAEAEHTACGKWVLSTVEEYLEVGDVPNYCGDLNAMHEAGRALTDDEYAEYSKRLLCHIGSFTRPRYHDATAIQRAKAFLVAIGKWRE